MALFKILKGPEKKDALGNSVMLSGTNGAPPLHEGWAYVTDEGNLYVDLSDKKRVKINQNADYAIVAEYDIKNQPIISTYIKNATLNTSATKPTYTFTRGDNTTFSVNIPIASATLAGIITTGSQTLTGAKTLDANGSLIIQGTNGLTYSGIESASGDSYRPVWFARSDKNGTPVYNTNFTYNPNTATLKVANLDGLAAKATADGNGDNIRSTYVKSLGLTTNKYGITYQKGDGTETTIKPNLAASGSNGGSALSAEQLNGTASGATLPVTHQANGSIKYFYNVNKGVTGNMPAASNANGIIQISKHGGDFDSQLGFSSNGNIYYRSFHGSAINNTTAWKQLAYTDGTIANATKALQDSQGQQINTTYLKNIALVNHATLPKYTITKGDGNTFDVNLPVANESNAGVITNTTQALAGNKSLKGSLSTTESITTAKQLISNIATGTSPLKVTSTTVVTNLNADTVDGMHASNNSFTQANASDTTLPTQLAIWNSLNSLLISAQALVYRGTLTPTAFAALSASGVSKGDVFVVSAEGNFGGKYCEPGDMLICYDKTSTAVTWDIVQTNIDGSVVIKGGGAAATVHTDVHAIARFDSNTGRVIDNSKVFIDDNGHVTAKATETQDMGTSNNKWRTIYAKSFNGLATNATADSSGQNIMDTYIKDWTLTKHATQPFVTLTKGNGNTSDINLPIAGQNDAGLITNAAQTIYGVKTFNTSIIAKSDHDFISHGNEFNVIPKLSANIAFNFNYRQKDGNGDGKITQYNFCNGAGGILASISQGQFSGNAATATKATQDSTGQQINTTYIKSVRLVSGTNPSYEFTRGDNTTFSVNVPISDLDGHYVKKSGDTMTGNLTINATLFAGSKLRLWSDGEGGNIRFITPGNANNIYEFDNWNNTLRLYYSTNGGGALSKAWYFQPDGTLESAKFKGVFEATSGFGKVYTFTKTLRPTTSWIRTGIISGDLPTGVYIIYMTGLYNTDMSWQNGNIYAGIVSWYAGGTNSDERFEILLHSSGHAHNGYKIFLSTMSHPGNPADSTTLELKSSVAFSRDTVVTFKFVKIL